MPAVSLDCILVGFVVLVFAVIVVLTARMIDRHLGQMDQHLGRELEIINDTIDRRLGDFVNVQQSLRGEFRDAIRAMSDAVAVMRMSVDRMSPGPHEGPAE